MGLNIWVGYYGSENFLSEEMGSYSHYNHWRQCIASSAGFDLNKMTGFDGDIPWHKEPFQLILYHPNCEGRYSVNQLHKLLIEVEAIKKLEVDDFDQSDKLIRLIKHAIKTNKPLMFM